MPHKPDQPHPGDNRSPARVDRYQSVLCLLLFASGALALVYELLWIRRFTAVFGATTPATAATLIAVFLGFTVGNLVLGNYASRMRRPLRVYGLIEVGVGLSALLVEPLVTLYGHAYPAMFQAFSGSTVGFTAANTALAIVAVFIPSCLMGGTIPVLGQTLAAEQQRLGVVAGGLYAANTLGATIGALSVPFFWLPKLGATTSYGVCVALSVLVGLIACALDRGNTVPVEPVTSKRTTNERIGETSALSPAWWLLTLAALSGVLTLILQVTWGRMFAQVHENSIYSFSVVLAVFLAGLAGGAAVARELLRRGWVARKLLCFAWIAAGLAVSASPRWFYSLTDGLAYLAGNGWTSYGGRVFWLTLPTVLLPTLLAGMVLPLLMEIAGYNRPSTPGQTLGQLLGSNTAGVIVGSLLAAFVLPAWLGMWSSLLLVGFLMVLVGTLCWGNSPSPWRLRPRQIVIVVAALVGFLYLNSSQPPRVGLSAQRGETLLHLSEGSHGIVAVVEDRHSRRIKLDNYYVLGGTFSTGDERMQAHLPLLLHPAPRTVAFLGLGTGISAGGALLHPVDKITAVEIVPEVVQVAKNFFAEANLGIVDAPRSEVLVNDARNFLRGSGRKFDVIVGDLVVPWRQGEAALYFVEHFQAGRNALAPGGLYCQWLPLFQMSEEEFNIVIASFLDVFPRATLWRGDFAPDNPALALVGHTSAAAIDPMAVERRVRELKVDERNPHLSHPAGLWIYLCGAIDPKAPRFAAAPRNRASEPWLELLGPLAHAGAADNSRSLFVGRRLENYLTEIRAQPLTGSPLEQLGSTQLPWRAAGAKLSEAILLLAEGEATTANVRMQEAMAELPPEVQRVFGGVPPTPSVK